MKKFSTIASTIAATVSLAFSAQAFAMDEMNPPDTKCAFLQNAPDQHVVIKGDTLWGISNMFLEHAWCWPQVWGMNREDIKNPHWIYPGQVVYLDRAAGRLRLGKPVSGGGSGSAGSGSAGGIPDVKLSPRIRGSDLAGNAITTIPPNMIEPFLSQPIVVEEKDLDDAPRVVAVQPGHVGAGKYEKIYGMGDLNGQTVFQIYRPATPLRDPVTKTILGWEAAYVGSVTLDRAGKTEGEAHRFIVSAAKEEVAVGNRLLPVPNSELANYVPHPPEQNVSGMIISIYGGVAMAGQNQTVAINMGAAQGMDVGTVLQMYHTGEVIVDRTKAKSVVKLPDEKYGELFIYRVFKNVSYGLIMQVSDSAQVGDTVRSPE